MHSFGLHKNLLHLKKHHRGKMVWRQGQEDRDEGLGDRVSTVFCVVIDN